MIHKPASKIIAMFLDQNFPPDIRVEKEIHTLQQANFDIRLFSLSYKNDVIFEEVRGIKVYRFKGNRLLYKLSALAYTIPLFHYLVGLKVKSFIDKIKPNYLHVHDMVIAESVFKIGKEIQFTYYSGFA